MLEIRRTIRCILVATKPAGLGREAGHGALASAGTQVSVVGVGGRAVPCADAKKAGGSALEGVLGTTDSWHGDGKMKRSV